MHITEVSQSFRPVDSISLERNEKGQIDLKMPQARYDKSDQIPVHQYGWGPFCKFYADTSDYSGTPGVYIFTVDHQIVYIGETTNIHNRIRSGYSNISPKNCFQGGQQTNCRINNAILEVVRNGGQVALWVMETEDRKEVEAQLIEECDPPWNYAAPNTFSAEQTTSVDPAPSEQSNKIGSTSVQSSASEASTSSKSYARQGKYGPLYDYLEELDDHTCHFSFEEIEDLLDAPLPKSAYEYPVWWSPTEGHSHAIGWADIGWSAEPDLESETVVFAEIR